MGNPWHVQGCGSFCQARHYRTALPFILSVPAVPPPRYQPPCRCAHYTTSVNLANWSAGQWDSDSALFPSTVAQSNHRRHLRIAPALTTSVARRLFIARRSERPGGMLSFIHDRHAECQLCALTLGTVTMLATFHGFAFPNDRPVMWIIPPVLRHFHLAPAGDVAMSGRAVIGSSVCRQSDALPAIHCATAMVEKHSPGFHRDFIFGLRFTACTEFHFQRS